MEEKEKINKEKQEEKVEKIEVVNVVPNENEAKPIEEQKNNENKEDVENSKSLSIASMVLGIVALCLLFEGLISTTCAILAIVFGVKGQKRANKKQAKAGFIMGIIALSLKVLLVIFGILAFTGLLFLAMAIA